MDTSSVDYLEVLKKDMEASFYKILSEEREKTINAQIELINELTQKLKELRKDGYSS